MRKIIRNCVILLGALLALIFGWRYAYRHAKTADNLPGLGTLQAEELKDLAGYKRGQLRSVWGEPDDVAGEEQDIWNREGGEYLIVTYYPNGRVKEAVFASP